MATGVANYRLFIREAVRGLWSGAIDYNQFFDAMESAIHRGLTRAWDEGAKECGVLPAELSPTERAKKAQAIANELNRIDSFATMIEAESKAQGGKLGRVRGTGGVMAKAETWILRYRDVVNHARVLACADQKLMWVHQALGFTKKPCGTCKDKLNGKVKRGSQWDRAGVRPQNPPNGYLECEGWG